MHCNQSHAREQSRSAGLTIAQDIRRFCLFLPLLLAPAGLSGCGSESRGSDETDAWLMHDSSSPTITFDDLLEQSRTNLGHREAYVVEGDIVLNSEEALYDYYVDTYLRPKSIINLTSEAHVDVRPNPMSITYCIHATLAPSATEMNTLRGAMRDWEAVAAVRFVESASCTNLPAGSFTILDVATNWSYGAYPELPVQELGVGTDGMGAALARHELGHILGFRHEHIHSGADPEWKPPILTNAAQISRCTENPPNPNMEWYELTTYDPLSVMRYTDCTQGQGVQNVPISVMDGIGARMVYRPPHWWWSGVLSPT